MFPRAVPPPRVNVTPLIDVMMCLIVFFLIVGRLASMRRPEVALPESRSGERAPREDAIVLTIDADGRTRLDGDELDPGALPDRLARSIAARPEAAIEIRADRGLEYGAISEVIEACRASGASAVRLAVHEGVSP